MQVPLEDLFTRNGRRFGGLGVVKKGRNEAWKGLSQGGTSSGEGKMRRDVKGR